MSWAGLKALGKLAVYDRSPADKAAARIGGADIVYTNKTPSPVPLDVCPNQPIRGDNPLLTARNCFITPHISWAPRKSRRRLMEIVVENRAAFLRGAPQNVVNPWVQADPETAKVAQPLF